METTPVLGQEWGTPFTCQIDGVATLVRSLNFTLVRGRADDESEIQAEDESRHSIDLAGEGSATPVNSKMF